jgi:hypothetical protein
MEIALAILGAGPIGFFTDTRKRGLRLYLLLWAIVFPVQTLVVYLMGDLEAALYFVTNVAILAIGIGLNLVGSMLGERRRGRTVAPGPT